MSNNQSVRLGSIYLVAFLDMLGFGVIIPVIRDFTLELSRAGGVGWASPPVLSGILMASYSLFQFLFAPLLGRLSDQYGRKPILLVSIFGNILSYGLWVISQDFWVFLGSRIISGATGGNISVAQSYIADVTNKEERGRAMGMMGAVFGLGLTIGPFLGGAAMIISDNPILSTIKFNGYSHIGLIIGGLSIINLLYVWIGLAEPRERVLTAGKKVVNPVVLTRSLLKPQFGMLVIIFFLMQLAFIHLEATLSWDLLDRFNLSTEHTGYFFAYLGIVMIVIQGGVYRRMHKKHGENRLSKQGLLAMALGLILIPLYSELWYLMIVIIIFAYGMGLASPSLTTLGSLVSSEDEQGMNLGIMQSFGSLARIIAPVTANILYSGLTTSSPFTTGGFLAFIAFVLMLRLKIKDSEHLKNAEN